MGLGETTHVTIACLIDANVTPGTNLIVTTKTYVSQWAREITKHFDEGHAPSVLIVGSNKISVTDIIDGHYDFIVCSYGFVQAQHKKIRDYDAFFEKVRTHGQAEAQSTTSEHRQKRHQSPLFSEFYSILGKPFTHLVLDESHNVKNWTTARHRAIKALHYEKFLAVTGTPISNRWWDIYGMIMLCKEHPFPKLTDFFRIFGDAYAARCDTPPPSKLPRLVKFPMELAISRPASLLKLPDLKVVSVPFAACSKDSRYLVAFYKKLFLDSVRNAKHTSDPRTFRRALIFATRAQQYAAHPLLPDFTMDAVTEAELNTFGAWMARRAIQADGNVSGQPTDFGLQTSLLLEALQYGDVSIIGAGRCGKAKGDDEDDDDDDADYNREQDLAEDDDDDGASIIVGGVEKAEKEKDGEARRKWLKRLHEMDDREWLSPRLEAIYEAVSNIQGRDAQARVVIFFRYRKFLDILEEHRKGVEVTESFANKVITVDSMNKDIVLCVTPATGGVSLEDLFILLFESSASVELTAICQEVIEISVISVLHLIY